MYNLCAFVLLICSRDQWKLWNFDLLNYRSQKADHPILCSGFLFYRRCILFLASNSFLLFSKPHIDGLKTWYLVWISIFRSYSSFESRSLRSQSKLCFFGYEIRDSDTLFHICWISFTQFCIFTQFLRIIKNYFHLI